MCIAHAVVSEKPFGKLSNNVVFWDNKTITEFLQMSKLLEQKRLSSSMMRIDSNEGTMNGLTGVCHNGDRNNIVCGSIVYICIISSEHDIFTVAITVAVPSTVYVL